MLHIPLSSRGDNSGCCCRALHDSGKTDSEDTMTYIALILTIWLEYAGYYSFPAWVYILLVIAVIVETIKD